ncbi:MAG TPA: AgmX/PglI C-terminal domain-containing protein [Kofleriaceae bacterium]|nr:AgmX/PglI C-terminal domain-containing protein [Kofleriaceae bacterium]
MRHLTIIAILVGTARADTQVSVRWGTYTERERTALVRLHGAEDATIRGATIELASSETAVTAKLRFNIATKSREALTIRVPIELTSGTAVTGFRYGIGGEPTIEAITRSADDALMTFNRIVERQKDPALLRLVKRKEKRDMLELAVYPVTRGMPASVEIDLTLPQATRLVLDSGPRQTEQAFALPETRREWAMSDPASHEQLDAATSWFAGDVRWSPARSAKPDRRVRMTPTVALSDRRYDVRVAIREHATQLAHCYAAGVARDATLSPSAMLAIDIATDGRVSHAEVTDYADADVRWCIEDEIAGWRFTAADNARRVRQDVDLTNLE